MFPVNLSLKGIDYRNNVGSALKSIKEQLRRIPNKGVGYGMLKFLNSTAFAGIPLESLRTFQQIYFNFFGKVEQSFSVDSGMSQIVDNAHANAIGPAEGSSTRLTSLIEVNAAVVNEQLEVEWTCAKLVGEEGKLEQAEMGWIYYIIVA